MAPLLPCVSMCLPQVQSRQQPCPAYDHSTLAWCADIAAAVSMRRSCVVIWRGRYMGLLCACGGLPSRSAVIPALCCDRMLDMAVAGEATGLGHAGDRGI